MTIAITPSNIHDSWFASIRTSASELESGKVKMMRMAVESAESSSSDTTGAPDKVPFVYD